MPAQQQIHELPAPVPNHTDVKPCFKPCEICDETAEPTFHCVHCDSIYCSECWNRQGPHKPGKVGPDGLPHEKADPRIVNRLRDILTPPADLQVQQSLHIDDEDTTWFGIARDSANIPVFQDYGRYATIIANSAGGEYGLRYPQLVSFIGQTGAGKSTIVKMLIDQQECKVNPSSKSVFPSPVVGSTAYENLPTSGDVHLYSDPGTYTGPLPMLYADCEGLEGGENLPVSARYHASDTSRPRKSFDTGQPDPVLPKKRRKLARGPPRNIAWANSPETRKRQYAVTELYPRLLYTFSDVIVFVLRNPKTFESAVLGKLLKWASTSVEKSLNQPTLPHAVIALNATNVDIDKNEWDVEHATNALMSSVAKAIDRDHKYREFADYWVSRGRQIHTMKDLLECYYSSITVVRIPTKGRYMLIDEQVEKLHRVITAKCQLSNYMKRKARMLSNSDELHVYLQSAFDHFSQNLDTPFNFIDVAFKNNPIPLDFGGNILKLAVAMRDCQSFSTPQRIFQELSQMVASCVMLDCVRHGLKGPAEQLLERYYMDYCDYALDDFCALFWPCSFSNKNGRCCNVKEGHTKGHQNEKGKIISGGQYYSYFSWDSFENEWMHLLQAKVQHMQTALQLEMVNQPQASENLLASRLHHRYMNQFYLQLGGANHFKSHSACFCCLREMPEHPLPCGHVLCSPCIKEYGRPDRGVIYVDTCPLHEMDTMFTAPWIIQLKPELAGVRVLSLDGGGMRGIVELEVLREIEKALGDKIPIQAFFDLIVGTSTGGIIALGLGVEQWRVETCIKKFTRLVDKAFTRRLPGMRIGSRYKTRPLVETLEEAFKDEFLFGGPHESPTSYLTKVAVTATTDTGERAVILTNYNRQVEAYPNYNFVRPDKPTQELKLWEVARATSAAPTYFKPFVNERTKEGYLDGALFHNNPVYIANHERKLIWPDVESCHPDILLSIGTGHHGTKTEGAVVPGLRHQWRTQLVNEVLANAESIEKKPRIGGWFKMSEVAQFLNVMVNRVDNILDAERIWQQFRTEVLDSHKATEGRRYERINPNLGFRPPKLDEKDKLWKVQQAVVEKLRLRREYRVKIWRVAHRLIASSFYFEKLSPPKELESHYAYSGKIRCRFANGSPELRHLGDFLRQQQEPRFQPYFIIQEKNYEQFGLKVKISPTIVEGMIQTATFDIDPVDIYVSLQLGATTIALCLMEDGKRAEAFYPISGFPRALVVEEALQRTVSPPDAGQTRPATFKKRKSLRSHKSLARLAGDKSPPLSISQANSPPSSAHSSIDQGQFQSSNTNTATQYPNGPDDVNDWVTRRAYAGSFSRNVDMAPPRDCSFEISTSSIPELDEDEVVLAQAIEASLLDAERGLGLGLRRTPTGTDESELSAVLEKSKIVM